MLIGISRAGQWFHFTGDPARIPADTWCNEADCVPVLLSPDRADHRLVVLSGEGPEYIRIDAALPVLHGKNGEDGTVQGLIELAGIPLAGCGTLASALCMDKDRAHKLAHAAGVRIPVSLVIGPETPAEAAEDFAAGRDIPSLSSRSGPVPHTASRRSAVRRSWPRPSAWPFAMTVTSSWRKTSTALR